MGSSDSDADGDGDLGPEPDPGGDGDISSESDPGPGSDVEAAAARPRGRSRTAAIGVLLAAVLLGSSLVIRSPPVRDPTLLVAAVGILALLAGGLLWRRAGAAGTAGTAGTDGSDDGDSDVWNAIPSWQYDGRHVESGGLTRGEQESALREIQRRADELEERERN